ncbi:MAG TPA: TetR family transcriptional regulator [Actinospica sp.]|nr:TetR family transcriptional regulator [Actinospica sp.]
MSTQVGGGAATADGGAGEPAGLRRRKKDRTRQLLREGGARLFAERGFAGTTVADIAECADVSVRTFFRYFDSKEALLLPDSAELFAYVEQALAGRSAEEEPLHAVCNALLDAAAPFAASSLTVLTHPLESMESVVAARLVRAFAEFEDRLTALVLDRIGTATPEADLQAAVIAGAALSAVRAFLRTRRARRAAAGEDGEPDPVQLPQAFAFLFELGDG